MGDFVPENIMQLLACAYFPNEISRSFIDRAKFSLVQFAIDEGYITPVWIIDNAAMKPPQKFHLTPKGYEVIQEWVDNNSEVLREMGVEEGYKPPISNSLRNSTNRI